MVVYFDLLVDLVILTDQLLDCVLLDHVEYVALGIKVGRVNVHSEKDLNFFIVLLNVGIYFMRWDVIN